MINTFYKFYISQAGRCNIFVPLIFLKNLECNTKFSIEICFFRLLKLLNLSLMNFRLTHFRHIKSFILHLQYQTKSEKLYSLDFYCSFVDCYLKTNGFKLFNIVYSYVWQLSCRVMFPLFKKWFKAKQTKNFIALTL